MTITIQNQSYNVSFPEITDHTDSTRVLQCVIKNDEGRFIKQATSVCNDRNRFNKINHEKIALKAVLFKMLPNPEDGDKSEVRSIRREIWTVYLLSSTRRRKLISINTLKEMSHSQVH